MSPDIKLEFENLNILRKGFKTWITYYLNGLSSLKASNSLTRAHLENHKVLIKDLIDKVLDTDIKIVKLYLINNISASEHLAIPNRAIDAKVTYDFILDAQTKLINYSTLFPTSTLSGSVEPITTLNDILKVFANKQVSGIELDYPVFDSDKSDKFAFKDWFDQFKAVMEIWPKCEDKLKLSYLKTKLEGNAKTYIASLEQTNTNYKEALSILKTRYHDKQYIIDELFKDLLNERPGYEPEYEKTILYLARTQARLADLKTSYKVDLLAEESAGYKLVSHIVFNKLSPELQKLIILEVNSNYPTLTQIFDNYDHIIKMLVKTKRNVPPR